jgi:hypothetical protein
MNLNKKLTKSVFRQKADRILMRLSMDVTHFWEDTREKRDQRLQRAAPTPCISAGPICPIISAMLRPRSIMS